MRMGERGRGEKKSSVGQGDWIIFISELSNYFPGYNIHSVSAIDSSVLLEARPKGGVAVIYPDSLGD